MDNKEKDLKQISFLLGSWITAIRLQNALSYFDINRVSQGFALKLLNLLYGYSLEDLDAVKKNYPGLDLGELKDSGVAFQVTSRTDTDKVISTLKKVVAHQLHDKFKGGIKFLILREGETITFGKRTNPKSELPSFNPDNDILYPENITVQIGRIYDNDDMVTIFKIKDLVEKSIKPNLMLGNDEQTDKFSAILDTLSKKMDEIQQRLKSHQKTVTILARRDETIFPEMKTRSKRKELVSQCLANLQQHPILWINGINSTGKTTLTYLIGKQLDTEKLWIDLREIEANQVLNHITAAILGRLERSEVIAFCNLAAEIINAFGTQPLLILNDLPRLNQVSESDRRDLMSFLDILTSNDFLIIITTNFPAPIEFTDQLENKIIQNGNTKFGLSETTEVIQSYGAPEDILEDIAEMIGTISDGHPLIVNAISKFLHEKGWNLSDDNLNKIFKGDYSQNINSQTYQRVLDSTADEGAIELLYRLKEINGNITVRNIDVVSAIKPAIKLPHNKISILSDIWLQTVENNVYQISPLVKALSSNLAREHIKKINMALAKSVFSTGKAISPQEAIRGIMYYVKGESYTDAALVLISILQKFMDAPKYFLQSGFKLFWFSSPIPVQVPMPLRFFIRFLQIQLYLVLEKDYEYLYKDLQLLQQTKEVDEFSLGIYHFISYRIKLTTQSPEAMMHLLELERLLPMAMETIQEAENEEFRFSNAFWLTFGSLKKLDDYRLWFEKFEELKLDKQHYDPITNFAYVSSGLSLSIQLPHFQVQLGNDETIRICHYVLNTALDKNLNLLGSYALKCIVAVLGSVHRLNDAKHLIDSHRSLLSDHQIYEALIIGELGHQYYLSDQLEEAVSYLKPIIEIEMPGFYTERIEFLKDYSKAADDPELSHQAILQALEIVFGASEYYTLYEKLKLYGEIGISFMKRKEYKASMEYLEKGYDILHKSFEDTDEFKSLVIRYGHTANYVSQFIIPDYPADKEFMDNYVVPIRGFFYFTNEKLIESGFYFEERRYLGALLFKTAFEYLDNYEIARKWAMEALQVTVNVPEPQFAAVLNTCIFYLIQDKSFQKALNIYFYIKNRRTLEASGTVANHLARSTNMAIAIDDVVFYEHILIPILYVQCVDMLKGTITRLQLYEQVRNVLEHQNMVYNDVNTKNFIHQILEEALVNNKSVYDVYYELETYRGDYTGQVLTIGYLVLSTLASAKDAASMQLSMITRIDGMCKHPFIGYYKFLVFPFYEAFWLEKFRQCADEFIDHEEWMEKGVPYFVEAKDKIKFKKLFKTLIYHLELNISTTIEEWLSSK